ncbi:MAG: hypothetical protein ABWY16_15640 [Pedobacter sp.]|uniref:hypothetical protein n=1 Tax=Pedobacter sp. TaxID=1411316 RepID=UPI00339130EA
MAKSWYFFIGGDDPLDSSKYIKVPVGKHMCLCGDKICAIYAEGIDREPVSPLSDNMKVYIRTALSTGQLQPEIPVGAKKFVYLKDY